MVLFDKHKFFVATSLALLSEDAYFRLLLLQEEKEYLVNSMTNLPSQA